MAEAKNERAAVSLEELRNTPLKTRDETESGRVYDCVFDENNFRVKYVVAETGSWLRTRRVYLDPDNLNPDLNTAAIDTSLTSDQVESAPTVDTDPPFSREIEIAAFSEYGWSAALTLSPSPYTGLFGFARAPECDPADRPSQSPSLRSMREIIGYRIRATDGRLGYVRDFIVDDKSWKILYLVIDTNRWLPSRKVLLLPHWITGFDWLNQEVVVSLSRNSLETGSRFTQSEDLDPEHAMRLGKIFAPIADYRRMADQN